MSKVGGDNREGRDPEGGRIASVHELDAARGRHQQDVSRPLEGAPASPKPDRAAALNMLDTFDLDGIDVPSPDEVLSTVEGSTADSAEHAPPEDRPIVVDGTAVRDVDSDEILRELEEHHRRGHPTVRPSAPRGSAELQPKPRRAATRAQRRMVRKETPTRPQHRGRPTRATLIVAALVPLTIAAGTVALAHNGRTAARGTSRTTSSRLTAAAEFTPFISTKIFGAITSVFASEARGLARGQASPVEHPRRKRRTRKPTAPRRVVRQAATAPVVSTTPSSSASSSSSSSSAPASTTQSAASEPAPASTTQSAASEPAPATSTHYTQPAFGQNGSLGPGRGAPGTQ
jgi:hypothetical protein